MMKAAKGIIIRRREKRRARFQDEESWEASSVGAAEAAVAEAPAVAEAAAVSGNSNVDGDSNSIDNDSSTANDEAIARLHQAQLRILSDDEDRKPAAVEFHHGASLTIEGGLGERKSKVEAGGGDGDCKPAVKAQEAVSVSKMAPTHNGENSLLDDEAYARELQASLIEGGGDIPPSYRLDEALLLVSKVNEIRKMLIDKFPNNPAYPEIKAVMPLSSALRFLQCQEAFSERDIPSEIVLSYHYTKKEYMAGIREYGLLTKKERRNVMITSQENGSSYGDGVYLSNKMCKYLSLDPSETVGLIVARLDGDRPRDSVTGNGFIVVKRSSQCLPLVEFPARFSHDDEDGSIGVDQARGAAAIRVINIQLHKLVQQAFNQRDVLHNFRKLTFTDAAENYPQPASMLTPAGPKPRVFKYSAPAETTNYADESFDSICRPVQCVASSGWCEDCPICFRPPTIENSAIEIKTCGHKLCADCLRQMLNNLSRTCPTCRKSMGISVPRGAMPSGEMSISEDPTLMCLGFRRGSFIIRYSFKSGIQKEYHPEPGIKHSGTKRTAYLPSNVEGKELLKRLVFAFQHGLTFSVGTSLTTGKPNQITWASIHHKTKSATEGSHGFPDENYFSNVNDELDALDVPKAADL